MSDDLSNDQILCAQSVHTDIMKRATESERARIRYVVSNALECECEEEHRCDRCYVLEVIK